MVGGLGTPELLIILFLFFMLFGIERLPKMARSMGQARGEFSKGLKDVVDPPELKEGFNEGPTTKTEDEPASKTDDEKE